MLHVIIVTVLGLLTVTGEPVTISAADWPAPHRADTLLPHPPLAALVRSLGAHERQVLRIRHAGGEDGARLADDLRAALVALGIASERLRLEPAAAGVGELVLEIVAIE